MVDQIIDSRLEISTETSGELGGFDAMMSKGKKIMKGVSVSLGALGIITTSACAQETTTVEDLKTRQYAEKVPETKPSLIKTGTGSTEAPVVAADTGEDASSLFARPKPKKEGPDMVAATEAIDLKGAQAALDAEKEALRVAREEQDQILAELAKPPTDPS